MIDPDDGVPVKLTDENVAHFANLMLCGSVWACPVCSARIREVRAQEIEQGMARHLEVGGSAGFLTLTCRHHDGQPLEMLMRTVSDGFRSVLGSRGWREDRDAHGFNGTIRSMEPTHGSNGWHPHLHVLILSEQAPSSVPWDFVADRLYARWLPALTRAGLGPPTRSHGVHLQEVRNMTDVARYTSKILDEEKHERAVGRELTRHDLKQARRGGHRTPFTILADYALTKKPEDRALWREYELATKGKRSLQWSRGLKAALRVEEKSDAAIIDEEIGGRIMQVLRADDWRYIRRHRLQALVLEAAEDGPHDLALLVQAIQEEADGEARQAVDHSAMLVQQLVTGARRGFGLDHFEVTA